MAGNVCAETNQHFQLKLNRGLNIMKKFTVTGNKKLDFHIHHDLHLIAQKVRQRCGEGQLDCLALGGGYGRGEGGTAVVDGEQRPYNDYDLVLIHHHQNMKELQGVLSQIHHEESERCGLHVDITPIHRNRVERLPQALTWYELGHGHRIIWGDKRSLKPLNLRRLNDVHTAANGDGLSSIGRWDYGLHNKS